ncbi:MAG: PAS domain-containing protein, partial [Candidatus Paceibacterota bacterium]
MYELLKNRLRLLGYGQILFLAVFCVAGLIAVWLGVQQGVRVFYADQQDTFENETSEISARANQHIVFAEDILHSINAYLAASEDVSGAELERFISQLHRGSQFNDVRATYFIPSRIVQDDQHSIVQDQESLIFSSHGESQVDDVLSQLETPELSRAIEEVLRRNEDRAAVHRDGEEILVHILSPAISDGQVIGVVGSKVSLTVFAQENLENRSFGYVIASDDPGGDRNVLLARSAEEGGFVSRIFRLFGIGLWQKTTSFRTADVTWELAFIEDPVSSNSVALQAILLSLISVAWASVFLLTGIFMLLMTNEAHAQRRADELTTQLREHQKNLAFHSSILHALNEGVIAANIEGGIIYWDKRMEEMFGYDSEEVKGEKVFILADTEAGVRQNAEQIFAQLKAGETWSGEFPMRRKNGEQFYGFISASPMRDVDGKEVAGVVATISTNR